MLTSDFTHRSTNQLLVKCIRICQIVNALYKFITITIKFVQGQNHAWGTRGLTGLMEVFHLLNLAESSSKLYNIMFELNVR